MRSNPTLYPSSGLIYDPTHPLSTPVIVNLEMNGLRLRFDGADQRLRLIEVTSFPKSRLSYNGSELVRSGSSPSFRYTYNKLFGPTYPGEYLPDQGVYILSYPGISFSFPVDKDQWKDNVDFVSLLSSASAQPATSMAIFHGPSWAEARNQLFTKPATNPRNPNITSLSAKQSPANDEIDFIRIHHSLGKIELVRRHNPPFFITLHNTTPQDLLTELGPPTSIYHKNDHRLSIHRAQGALGATSADDIEVEADLTNSDNGESEDEEGGESDSGSADYFYNYYSHGFDVYISTSSGSSSHLATKIILHGNVPGSYEFHRYRRARWEILYASGEMPGSGESLRGSPHSDVFEPAQPVVSVEPQGALNSEMSFGEIYVSLKERFGQIQKPMLLNRASDSPSSSVELLGGWDEGESGLKGAGGAEEAFGNTGELTSEEYK